jgi:hypothetical protein
MRVALVFKGRSQVHSVAASSSSVAHLALLGEEPISVAQTADSEQLDVLRAARTYVASWILPSGQPLCNVAKVQSYLVKKSRIAVASAGRF